MDLSGIIRHRTGPGDTCALKTPRDDTVYYYRPNPDSPVREERFYFMHPNYPRYKGPDGKEYVIPYLKGCPKWMLAFQALPLSIVEEAGWLRMSRYTISPGFSYFYLPPGLAEEMKTERYYLPDHPTFYMEFPRESVIKDVIKDFRDAKYDSVNGEVEFLPLLDTRDPSPDPLFMEHQANSYILGFFDLIAEGFVKTYDVVVFDLHDPPLESLLLLGLAGRDTYICTDGTSWWSPSPDPQFTHQRIWRNVVVGPRSLAVPRGADPRAMLLIVSNRPEEYEKLAEASGLPTVVLYQTDKPPAKVVRCIKIGREYMTTVVVGTDRLNLETPRPTKPREGEGYVWEIQSKVEGELRHKVIVNEFTARILMAFVSFMKEWWVDLDYRDLFSIAEETQLYEFQGAERPGPPLPRLDLALDQSLRRLLTSRPTPRGGFRGGSTRGGPSSRGGSPTRGGPSSRGGPPTRGGVATQPPSSRGRTWVPKTGR